MVPVAGNRKGRRRISLYPAGSDERSPSTQVAVGAISASVCAVFAVAMSLVLFFVPHGKYTAFLARPWRFDPAGFHALLLAVAAVLLCFGFLRVSRVAACISLVVVLAITVFFGIAHAHAQAMGFMGMLLAGTLVGIRGVFRLHKLRVSQHGSEPRLHRG